LVTKTKLYYIKILWNPKNGSGAEDDFVGSKTTEMVKQSLLAPQFPRPLHRCCCCAAAAVICPTKCSTGAPMEWLSADRNWSRM